MDAREFAEWMAYYELDPFGEERADLRAGIIASTFANANLGKGRKPYAPSDFMPQFRKTAKRKASPNEIGMKLMSYFRIHNKLLEKKRKRLEVR